MAAPTTRGSHRAAGAGRSQGRRACRKRRSRVPFPCRPTWPAVLTYFVRRP